MCRQCVVDELDTMLDQVKHDAEKLGAFTLELPFDICCMMTPPGDRVKPYPRRHSLRFPVESISASKRTIVLIRLAQLISETVRLGAIMTVRDIYYLDVKLFGMQEQVRWGIEVLCLSMGCTRELLNIVPSPKGLLMGSLNVSTSDLHDNHTLTEIRRSNGASLIPVGRTFTRIECLAEPRYILVVEKEAVFSQICKHLPEAVVITGKGFPDHYTRKFLAAFHSSYPCTPIYGLVDSDVAGFQILRLYQSPSDRSVEFHHPIKAIKWLGVGIMDYSDGWLALSPADRKRILNLFKKKWLLDDDHLDWKYELQRQMVMGMKAEMNVLDHERIERLASYVRRRVNEVDMPLQALADVAGQSEALAELLVRPTRKVFLQL